MPISDCLTHELGHIERFHLEYCYPVTLPDTLFDEAEVSLSSDDYARRDTRVTAFVQAMTADLEIEFSAKIEGDRSGLIHRRHQ